MLCILFVILGLDPNKTSLQMSGAKKPIKIFYLETIHHTVKCVRADTLYSRRNRSSWSGGANESNDDVSNRVDAHCALKLRYLMRNLLLYYACVITRMPLYVVPMAGNKKHFTQSDSAQSNKKRRNAEHHENNSSNTINASSTCCRRRRGEDVGGSEGGGASTRALSNGVRIQV